jgi:hypothetical protein
MKDKVAESQNDLDINTALDSDNEIENSHMYKNAPESNEEATDANSIVKPKKEKSKKSLKSTPLKDTSLEKSKGKFKTILKWIVMIVILLSIGMASLWVYANKAVLFPSSNIATELNQITSVDEINNTTNMNNNPYVTQQDLREFSSGIRQDFKEALREYSKGLDKIDSIEDQMAGIRSKFNELKTIVMQQSEGTSSAANDKRYEELLTKLSDVDSALNKTSVLSEQIASLQATNLARSKLEKHFKNNDWDLRKRMELVESETGLGPKIEKPINPAVKKYSAAMRSKPVKPTKTFKNRIEPETVKIGSSKSVVWENKHRWKIRMISNALTLIQNIDTGNDMRISEGIEIEGCGLVLAIDVADRTVTTQHCVISTKGK